MSGILYGVGLGPGDPELMTLKAHRLISTAAVIAYPALEGGDSFAREIAAGSIPPEAREIVIRVPMSPERAPARAAYDVGAAEIAAVLNAGQNVVMLCEGDPFFYGSFMYIHERLASSYDVQVVPGVSSIMACAAALGRPLTARNDTLTVLPATLPEAELRARLNASGAFAIMKLGRHLDKVRRILDDLDLTDRAGYVERASLGARQVVAPLALAPAAAPYFSMILIYNGDEPWQI